MRPRRWLLALGMLLMLINRVAALVLPYSTKFLIDTVINKHHLEQLKPLVLFVLAATLDSGRNFVFPDAVVVESGAAPDRRVARTGAGAHFTAAGRLL